MTPRFERVTPLLCAEPSPEFDREPEGDEAPTVLFVCVQNAGRSQMAAAYTRKLSDARVVVHSAGTSPADHIHPEVEAVLAEDGLDVSDQVPHALSAELVDSAHVIIAMGCDDNSPYLAGRRVLCWQLADPAGKPLEQVRAIRDDVRGHVEWLLRELDMLPSAEAE